MSASDQSSDQKHERPSLLDRVRNLFGIGSASVRDDIEDALDDDSTESDLSAQERVLLKNVLGLHELRVQDIMVPRADVIAVGLDVSLGDILTVFRTAGHSRLPVHGENLDDLDCDKRILPSNRNRPWSDESCRCARRALRAEPEQGSSHAGRRKMEERPCLFDRLRWRNRATRRP